MSLEALLLERLEQRFVQRGSNAQLSTDETALLETINQGFPESFWMRYRALIALRDQHALSDTEHAELIAMSDETEQLSAQRLPRLPDCGMKAYTRSSKNLDYDRFHSQRDPRRIAGFCH